MAQYIAAVMGSFIRGSPWHLAGFVAAAGVEGLLLPVLLPEVPQGNEGAEAEWLRRDDASWHASDITGERAFVASRAKGGSRETGSGVRKLSCESASKSLSITVSIDSPNRIAKTKGIGPSSGLFCCSRFVVVVLLLLLLLQIIVSLHLFSDGKGKSTVDCK